MDLSFLAITARLDVALMGTFAIICLQLLGGIIGLVLKQQIMPMPILEMVLRPLIIGLSNRLNRSDRTDFALMMRGIIVFFIIFAIIFGILLFFQALMPFLPQYLYFLPLVLFLSPVLPLKTIFSVSKGRYYQNLAIGLNQNLIPTDDHGMRREGAKLLSLALSDWLLIPVILFIMFGWPALVVFATLSLFIRVSSANGTAFVVLFEAIYSGIVVFANILLFPFMVMASLFSVGARPIKALKAIKYPHNMVLAMFAYGQDVVLGGPYQNRHGDRIKRPWIGEDLATAKLDHKATIRFIIFHATIVFLTIACLFVASLYL